MNEIFETLPDTDAGEDEEPFEKAVTALTNYFTPKNNQEYEVYVFRKAKQESDESISARMMHPEKNASVGIVARGIHIREEKLPALLMENYVAGVGSKTTLKLYVDPKIPTRETSPRIRNVTFKT